MKKNYNIQVTEKNDYENPDYTVTTISGDSFSITYTQKPGKYYGFVYKRELIAVDSIYLDDFGKVYVGSTDNFYDRNYHWCCFKVEYAGKKVEVYRKKYGVEAGTWDFEILEVIEADSLDELHAKEVQRENYYIAKFGSKKYGLNTKNGIMKGTKAAIA